MLLFKKSVSIHIITHLQIGKCKMNIKQQVQMNIDSEDKSYKFYNIQKLATLYDKDLSILPYSIRNLLENLIRNYDEKLVKEKDIVALFDWPNIAKKNYSIFFRPSRVLLQDFTGVPCVVDLAAMRDAVKSMGGNPGIINPIQPVDLVIDHSVQVDEYGHDKAYENNVKLEFKRNKERYQFMKWGQESLEKFRVVPPGTGIIHQVNLEYLSQGVTVSNDEIYPDSLVGTDSHTTMINGLGVVGWGVGGIEAEAAMLGQPISMLIPEVIGVKLIGTLKPGVTATDLVLTVTEILREKKVVGKFIEYFGQGLFALPLAARATLANMSPEYGATMGFSPIDQTTLDYLLLTGKNKKDIELVKKYTIEQRMFFNDTSPEPIYSDLIEIDLDSVEPSIAGPKRPQDRIALSNSKKLFKNVLSEFNSHDNAETKSTINLDGSEFQLNNGSIAIASITSCTNTSNPEVMIAAGLLAKKAVELGLEKKAWVKTSLAPGSTVVTGYLNSAKLLEPLEKLGFNLVGYGCTTCIGNSGPLIPEISSVASEEDVLLTSVLSGNRNFEARIHNAIQANYLASPPLVVAYAIAGTMDLDLSTEPLGTSDDGKAIYLNDIWPSAEEVNAIIKKEINANLFKEQYASVFKGDANWRSLEQSNDELFQWDNASTYIRRPTFFDNLSDETNNLSDIKNSRILAILGDSVTTDHISPAGAIAVDSPAGEYLLKNNVDQSEFNTYGSRRGNHEVMMRGTFGNIRLKNALVAKQGGWTKHFPSEKEMTIFDASKAYAESSIPLVILAGSEYGSGSSRDWAAKGTYLLGVKAVIAKSYERIHRSNLVGMGVLPLEFIDGQDAKSLNLDGSEEISINGINDNLQTKQKIEVSAKKNNGNEIKFFAIVRIDTPIEIEYYKNGGILNYVILELVKNNK
jgi:aconitate hydratase